MNKFDEIHNFDDLLNQFLAQDLEPQETDPLDRVREAAKSLNKNSNFKILKAYLFDNYLKSYPLIKDPVEASQELAFRRGLSILFTIVEQNE